MNSTLLTSDPSVVLSRVPQNGLSLPSPGPHRYLCLYEALGTEVRARTAHQKSDIHFICIIMYLSN